MSLVEQLQTFKELLIEASLSEDRELALERLFKKVEREIAVANFKYERMAKEKKALESILEATIQELDEKNQSLTQSNAQLLSAEEELRQNAEQLKFLNEGLETKIRQDIKDIEMQKELIEQKNKHIVDSINYAQRIQKSMLLADKEIGDILPEHFIFFRPRDIVSGDFYWFARIEGLVFAAAVDCTGHGVPGAFMSLILNDGLNEVIKLKAILEPAEILEEVHTYVTHALRQQGTANRDGADMSICRIDTQNKQVVFAGARQNLVYCRNGIIQEIKGTRESIGGYIKNADNQSFESHIINLGEEITTFYLSSDGYSDQFGGVRNSKLLRKNFITYLEAIHHLPCSVQKERLIRHFDEWKGDNDQLDDVLVIGFKA